MKRIFLGAAVAAVALLTSPQLGNGKPSKVSICHVPPGNADNAHEIDVDASAVYAHVFSPGHSGVLHSGPFAGTTVHDYIMNNTDASTGGCNSGTPQEPSDQVCICNLQ